MPILHPFDPYIDYSSKILILGSFPSVKSRENGFYYGHPQNRFWKVIANIYGYDVPDTLDEKKRLLTNCRIAIWDVLFSCEITGSADATIRNPVPNDISGLLEKYSIERIYANGSAAFSLYTRYVYPKTLKKNYKASVYQPCQCRIQFGQAL